MQYLKKIGLSVVTVETGHKRLNIIATYGISNSYLTFYAHSDTVPIATGWKQDPFTLKVSNGKAYGIGAGDMKGGLAVILQTAKYAVANNLPIKVIFAVDEENISEGAHDMVNKKALKNIGCVISAESGQITDFDKPYSVVFGRLGRSLFDIIVKGQIAHAAEAHKGSNAILKALQLVGALEQHPLPIDTHLGKAKILLQSIQAETQSYSVPDSCHLQYSLLSSPKLNDKDFVKLVKSFMKKYDIEGTIELHKRKTPYGACYKLNTSLPFVKKIKKDIFDADNVTPMYAQSVSDENIFANRLEIPVVVIGPIRDNAHKAQEWVQINSLTNLEEVYKKILHIYVANKFSML